MAVNALEGSPEAASLGVEAPSLSQVPAPLPSLKAKDKASQLADLEKEIQNTDQLIKETKTVSVNDLMGEERSSSKSKAKSLLKSSVKEALNIEDVQ